jgi:DNA-binding IclR family transcriptional regulator
MAKTVDKSAAPRAVAGTVRAVSRAIAVLRAFVPEHPYITLAEVAQAADLDKGTTRRLLKTLMEEGLVRQDRATQRYALALGMIQLSAAVQTGGLREEARPAMAQLAKDTGATTFLSVPGEDGALCLERIHGHDPVQVQWWAVGNHMPWNCGAGPRLLLAYTDSDRVMSAAAHFRALTKKSEMDPKRLRKHFGLVRERGYEVTIDDVVLGLSAVAVPVRDRGGDLAAALSLGGLTHLILRDDGEPRSLDALKAAAAEIGSHLP